jgi:DNA replication protein DnaC
MQLLIIDKLGYVPFTAICVELFFEVPGQRYKRGAMLIISNLPFNEWMPLYGVERLIH